eukprot:10002974-Ditylum_brightwellii.AAC.1
MDTLAISIQEQLSTNQNSLQQMMQEQHDHLDAKIIVLLGPYNETIAIQNQFGANLDGPHNKRQKHSNMDDEPVDIMEDADTLRCNRDACAPDSGGMGSP